ncbi:hypothetical protein ACFVVM_13165 [Nocardia sp. NPDC058176]|uniref:hypothetical protein n=1 Tax=Nocardia sp. NPDC058176 TaxID=3346368 RepID=UPI0036DF4E0B
MSFTKLLGASVAALAFGAVVAAGPAVAESSIPAPVSAPVPIELSTGSALTDFFDTLLRSLHCKSSYECDY